MSSIEADFATSHGGFDLRARFSLPLDGTTAVIGPSGSGKSTLLDVIAGIDRHAIGRLVVAGETWLDERRALPSRRRRIGYASQGGRLFAHLSVRENLRYGMARRPTTAVIGFDETVAMLGLAALLDRRPATLSAGERQRAALGRALLAQPRLLLLDEPLTGLDQPARRDIFCHLETIQRRVAVPILLVSHDLSEVARLADRLLLMQPGRVEGLRETAAALVDPGLPFAAAEDAHAVLIGRIVSSDARYDLCEADVAGRRVLLPGRAGEIGSAVRIRVFASDVAIARPEPTGSTILNRLPVTVGDIVAEEGGTVTAALRLGEDDAAQTLLARVTRKSWDELELARGEAVWALVKAVSVA